MWNYTLDKILLTVGKKENLQSNAYLSASTRESIVLCENLLVRESNKKQQQKKNNHIDNSKS